MTRKCLPGLLCLALLLTTARAAEPFPVPAGLQPDVDFWVAIFTRYTTDQGVLHDNRRLEIVYETIDFPAGQSRNARQSRIKTLRSGLQQTLKTLAGGKREGLSAAEAGVLALWPEDVSNAELAAAAGRIRYQQGLQDRFREGLQRAGRWRGFIEREFATLGVPVDLAALPHVESSYNPAARSHVGASGIWQFTRSTGRRFMRVDHVVDERNDPFAASRAAGQLLAYNYSITGNWPMAITAYNHGLAGVRRAMREYGDTAYTQILREYDGRTFGFASRNFYVAFLAARHVDQNAASYFPGLAVEPAATYASARLPAYVPADDLATALGITTAQLADYNPALQATVWQGSKHVPRDFELRLPAGALDQPLESLLAALPPDRLSERQLPDMFHRIARGETLSEIADRYDTRVSTLVALNQLGSANRIRAGQQLRLPAAGPAPPPAAATPPPPVVVAAAELAPDAEPEAAVSEEPTPFAMAGDLAANLLGTIQTTLLSDPSDYSVAADGTIEVHPLETLGHYGDWLEIRTQRLRDINGFAFRTPVEVGQRIRLDLGTVDAKTFESRRIEYHRAQQDSFFREHVITGISEHEVRRGESIWILSLREYEVPLWLFRQYNPELELESIRPGMTVRFPVMTTVERD